MEAYHLLGVEIHPYTVELFHELISSSIRMNKRTIVVSQNLHSVYIYHKNKVMQDLHKLSIKRIDGMPLIYIGRLYGYPLQTHHRVTWVDWIKPLMKLSESNNWKVFYLGAKPGIAMKGFKILESEIPSLNYKTRNGYFNTKRDSNENLNIIDEINEFKPDILMVGMGMPRQEKWIYENLDNLKTNVILTCGAAIEYVAGQVSTPPRWIGKIGLEWLFRLIENPLRFWKRYLVEPWFILYLLIKDILRSIKGKFSL